MPDSPSQLSLFDQGGAELGSELQGEDEFLSHLKSLVPFPLEVTFTNNRSSLISVRAKRSGERVVRLQRCFLASDSKTLKAVAQFIIKPDARARKRIDAFLRENQVLIETLARQNRSSLRPRTKGEHRDLQLCLRKIMNEYGLRLPKVRITWGKRSPARGRRSSIKFGSFNYERSTIIIHPALDDPEVPDYFVEFIIYHELLHALFPPLPGHQGRESAHGPEFKRFEKKFRFYREAREYEKRFVRTKLR